MNNGLPENRAFESGAVEKSVPEGALKSEKVFKAVIGLGGNLGEPAETIRRALEAVSLLPQTAVERTSSLYLTAPYGVPDEQPDYINAAALLSTALSPRALLGACLGIEAAFGRVRQSEKSARIIDIDLLLYEGAVSDDRELTLPHPRMDERAFVLIPLAELFPEMNALGHDFSAALGYVKDQRIKKL